MQMTVWLRLEAKKKYGKWVSGHVAVSKLKPNTRDNELAFKLNLEIPDEVFEEPVYEAKLILPKITRQFPETTEIASEVSKELSKKMGFKVRIEMPESSDPIGLVE